MPGCIRSESETKYCLVPFDPQTQPDLIEMHPPRGGPEEKYSVVEPTRLLEVMRANPVRVGCIGLRGIHYLEVITWRFQMANVFAEARLTGRPEGSAIEGYVVEDHADNVLGSFGTQQVAIAWDKGKTYSPVVARVRHLNDKKEAGSLAIGLRLTTVQDSFYPNHKGVETSCQIHR